MGYVYILQSLKNSRFYIGSTNNLERRLDQHQSGNSKYTSETLPFKLVFSQKYSSLQEARKIELWLKRQKDKNLIHRIIDQGEIHKSFS